MSSLEFRARGWHRTYAPAETLKELFGAELRSEPLEPARLGFWSAPQPTDLCQPMVGPESALRVVAHETVAVRLLPGSQGLRLPNEPGPYAVEIRLAPGEFALIDPRLWVIVEQPDRVRASLVRGAGTAATERLDAAGDFGWHSQGFVMLRGALSRDRVAALNAALTTAFECDITLFGRSRLERLRQLGAVRNLPDVASEFVDLLADSPAYSIIDRVLSPGYVVHSFDGLILDPGEGRFPWDFHTDIDPFGGMVAPRGRIPAVNVLYYLDRVTAENGATWIVPSSHLTSWTLLDADVWAKLAVQAIGEPGDVLIFDARLCHCAGNNTTNVPRRLIKTLFCEPWIQPQMDYRRALSEGKWERLPERVRAMLGERTAPASSTGEFLDRIAARMQ